MAKDTTDLEAEMPSVEEDLYKLLGIESDATPEAIKTAYKKSALRNHPDKVGEDAREAANAKFQKIALAYGVLSDPRRRDVYDRTGSTDEAFSEDSDFNWMDFYREQFSAMIDAKKISEFQKSYQNSEEEKDDLLSSYNTHKGDMDAIYQTVMLSNVLDDDERFRAIIDQAIADGDVKDFKAYSQESEKKKQQRVKQAQKEAAEAAKEEKKMKAKKKKSGKASEGVSDLDSLQAIISQRQKARGGDFLSRLEEKYAQPGDKRPGDDGPSEEAFAAVGARRTTKSRSKRVKA
ncbi:Heat shock protein DnaJ [Penicillium brevicompactum]|uniref:Heat shock protein DnaJ n=1 Tax=Penicillium brevicompactum TaxID=5074 RepID=A0A9W9UTI7_PENBR|nr:Heat shock protein DnaJ [Penicillium brevicompactum]